MADTKRRPTHEQWCKCARCLIGPLDKIALMKIPAVGECQRCHKSFEVVISQPCPFCKYIGETIRVKDTRQANTKPRAHSRRHS